MMNKKIIFTIFMVLLLLSSFGCSKSGSGPSKDSYKDQDFHTGTDGVSMEFVKNAPPDKLYEGDKFEAIVELQNEGAYPDADIFEGSLHISGIDSNVIRGSWQDGNDIPANFRGKSQYIPTGGYISRAYQDKDGVHVPFDADSIEQTVMVHLCYKYKTEATIPMCIDPDPYSVVQEDKVCEIKDETVSGGQGAPVVVTKVEEEVGSDRIYFRIYIQNKGDGSVIKRSAYNDCPFDLELSDIDKVLVEADLPFDGNPECTPAGTGSDPVRLTDGKGFIFCSFRKPDTDSAFTSPLQITLDYVYSTSISQDIEIVNLK